jgi:hypothetical protein
LDVPTRIEELIVSEILQKFRCIFSRQAAVADEIAYAGSRFEIATILKELKNALRRSRVIVTQLSQLRP